MTKTSPSSWFQKSGTKNQRLPDDGPSNRFEGLDGELGCGGIGRLNCGGGAGLVPDHPDFEPDLGPVEWAAGFTPERNAVALSAASFSFTYSGTNVRCS